MKVFGLIQSLGLSLLGIVFIALAGLIGVGTLAIVLDGGFFGANAPPDTADLAIIPSDDATQDAHAIGTTGGGGIEPISTNSGEYIQPLIGNTEVEYAPYSTVGIGATLSVIDAALNDSRADNNIVGLTTVDVGQFDDNLTALHPVEAVTAIYNYQAGTRDASVLSPSGSDKRWMTATNGEVVLPIALALLLVVLMSRDATASTIRKISSQSGLEVISAHSRGMRPQLG